MNVHNQITGFHLYLLLIAIALVAFMISLDGFIVNVALTTISGQLGVREDVGTWIITLFTMSSTVFVPLSACLSTRFGKIHLFLISLLLFTTASVLCGLLHNFSLLLIFRVLQGAGAGLLVPISLTLIVSNFPPEKRSIAVGFWSFFVMVGPAMGPMIGGWLANYRWPWMFYLNLPIGIFSGAVIFLILWNQREEKEAFPMDWGGIFLLFTSIGALQVALNRWNIDDWFHSSFIISLFVITVLAFVVFIIWELFHPNPFIDLSQFKRMNFALPSLTTGLGMGLLFSSFVLDSLWVQKVLGYTPFWAGLTLTPVGLFPLICYPIIGRFVSLLDLRVWVIISFVLYACTFFWLSRVTVYISFWQLAFPRLVQGIGFAIFTVPNSLLAIKGIKPRHLTSVVSLFSFIRMLFVGFAVALAITLWILRETFYQTRLTSKTYVDNPAFAQLLLPFETIVSTGKQTFALAYDTLVNEASTLAIADIYYLYGWLFLALCLPVLLYRPKA